MINDKPLEHRLTIYCPIPNQNEIRERLSRQFGHMAEPMAPVINSATEEVERLLIELCDPTESNQKEMSICHTSYTGKNKGYRVTGYHCRKCNYAEIKTIFDYCPCCGTKIKWIRSALKLKRA